MISVIVYGRNDAHGYNLHRRAALSLNCLAEVLTASDDEIVFVDYNTPDELPTFVEALSDTLTRRCLELLRVVRVPAELHEEQFGARTHLVVVEPAARNVAARRANPSNRWLLSTNTDMVFLPLGAQSLSEVCGEIDDGFYGLPRFELPEWLWERLPRNDPQRAMAELSRFGPGMRLDEPTVSHEWVRFDAPGDFQLVLRDDFFAIDGFDEEMLLGWHVDSNLSRRLSVHRGSIQSLEDRIAGYHCNHNRIPTVYHGTEAVANDLERFFYSIQQAELPAQRTTWGLADAELEEVPVLERAGANVAANVIAAIPAESGPRTASDAAEAAFALSYDSAHVLPFIADSLVVSAPGAVVGYIGINEVLEGMLASLVTRLGGSFEVADLEDTGSVDELCRAADVIVVDLGIDKSLSADSQAGVGSHGSFRLPAGLDRVFAMLEQLVQLERARLEVGHHPRRIVLVNSSAVLWDGYVLAHLACSHTTVHSRVRRATVKPLPPTDEAARDALARQRRLVRWAARPVDEGHLLLRAGEERQLAELSDYRGFREGWSYPDGVGIWTQGSRAELALALEGADERSDYVVVLSLAGICIGPEEALPVELLVNGEPAARRAFSQVDPGLAWVVELPQRVLTAGEAVLGFEIAEPRTPLALGWSPDDRPLGILLRNVTLLPADDEATQEALVRQRRLVRWAARKPHEGHLVIRPEEAIELGGLSDYRGFGEGWAYPEDVGIWTQGPHSELAVEFEGIDESDYVLALSLGSVCVGPDDSLRVDLRVNGEGVATRDFSQGDPLWVIELPANVLAEGKADLTFDVPEPRSPLALGWLGDDRLLGVFIRAMELLPADGEAGQAALVRQRRLVRWAARLAGEGRLRVRAGEDIEFAGLSDFRGFGAGWSFPDEAGIWTQGPRSELAIALGETDERRDHAFVLSLANIGVGPEESLRVDLFVNGEYLSSRDLSPGDPTWVIELPAKVLVEGKADLTFEVPEPRSPLALGWSADARPLGILIRSATLVAVDRSLAPGDSVDFIAGSGAERFLKEGWAALEQTGVWTIGERASLVVKLLDARPTEVELVLEVGAFVTADHPELEVEVSSLQERLAGRIFRYGHADAFLRVPFPAAAGDEEGHTVLDLRLREPAAPADLGVSDDARRLGLHLRTLAIRKTGLAATLRYAAGHVIPLARARLRPVRRLARKARAR